MPFTQHERKVHGDGYGTQTARLTTESQLRFGDCCLSLSPAVDPVATPSGNIYSRAVIVEYLLEKIKEIKQNNAAYETQIAIQEENNRRHSSNEQDQIKKEFLMKDQGSSFFDSKDHTYKFVENAKRKIDLETTEEGRKKLKHSSFWLAESQPQAVENDEIMKPLNKRPKSPNSGEDLRLKDLISISLEREDASDQAKCICAVSHKAITTQPVVLIKKTGVVLLKEVYEKIVKPNEGGMICPITGKRIKDKDVMELKKGSSGYSASGMVIATKYTPTMT